jgi:hypothetical protein
VPIADSILGACSVRAYSFAARSGCTARGAVCADCVPGRGSCPRDGNKFKHARTLEHATSVYAASGCAFDPAPRISATESSQLVWRPPTGTLPLGERTNHTNFRRCGSRPARCVRKIRSSGTVAALPMRRFHCSELCFSRGFLSPLK